MENCADCGKPIDMHEASYYRKDPLLDIGQSFHSRCGDPFGIKAKDAEIARLTLENWQLKGALGYPVPGDIPEGPFKCGLCEARHREKLPLIDRDLR